jgi:hypothetical protein
LALTVLRLLLVHATEGKRMLGGVSTILDWVIPQAITQVLNPIFDPDFSERIFSGDGPKF